MTARQGLSAGSGRQGPKPMGKSKINKGLEPAPCRAVPCSQGVGSFWDGPYGTLRSAGSVRDDGMR